jgi:hypothetical protein
MGLQDDHIGCKSSRFAGKVHTKVKGSPPSILVADSRHNTSSGAGEGYHPSWLAFLFRVS